MSGGFIPDPFKTFNRGYSELFLDGKRGKWAAMDAAKSMGELIGTVASIGRGEIILKLNKGVTLNNGDGFSFVSKISKIEGFRSWQPHSSMAYEETLPNSLTRCHAIKKTSS